MTKKLISTLIFIYSVTISAEPHNIQTVEGGALYLIRSGVETYRAEFLDKEDCKYIAKIMNEAEPLVRWHCSTSSLPIKYKCSISNIRIKNTETGEVTTENVDFVMSLNRNKASTSRSLDPAFSSFDYEESEKYLVLTNDYPYVNGNYGSRAVYKIRVNTQNGSVAVLDINMDINGEGICEKR
jgi:hypothetical protein